MNIAEIEFQLKELVEQPFNAETFVFRFLEIYDAAKATVAKLKQGSGNLAKAPDVLWKSKLFFRVAKPGQAAKTVDALAAHPLTAKHKPRILLATDGVEVYARDLKADQTTDIAFDKLNDAFDFFLPLANIERYEGVAENPADIKATGRLAKLYDEILKTNPDWISRYHTHELNLFMTRMLFCFFAEATSIFDKGIFTATLMSLTQEDGSDTPAVLDALFSAMNAPQDARKNLPEYARRFPYVNGGLFREKTPLPKFSKRARRLLKECGDLNWSEINPDIFGSMIQAVVEPEMRGDMGMHYTSVPNIMKVLHPLFLLSLEEDLENARDSEPKLKKLLDRIYHIRVFDPACGSGNFLIITYREMRKLETRIFQRLKEIAKQWSLPMSGVHLRQFYGIELADFACETAKLSLWIAEYQMNEQFRAVFGSAPPLLPLRDSGKIVHDNATRVDWEAVCPKASDAEVYVLGNPPYIGARNQSPEQKSDMCHVFHDREEYKDCDYVACWILKAGAYIRGVNASFAFVTTNSITQGEQVAYLWPTILNNGLELYFAHRFFKWSNNASYNAGVTCVIVGVRNISNRPKYIYSGDIRQHVSNITPYLTTGQTVFVSRSATSLSGLPKMVFGNQARDGGYLFLTSDERTRLLKEHPESLSLIRRVLGTDELIKGTDRYCLWIDDAQLKLANAIPSIRQRIEQVELFRVSSKAKTTNGYAKTPHKFAQRCLKEEESIIVPSTSSERRNYIPISFLPAGIVITNSALAVYGASASIFGLLTSRLHMVWLRAVGGQLETRLRYSAEICYNTFPFPTLSDSQQSEIERAAIEIIALREGFPGKTLEWLYDPDTMPAGLVTAHKELDDIVDRIYIGRSFKNDSERLEHLFKLYAAVIKKKSTLPTQKKGAA
jgi:hypothetical protein